MKMRTVYGIFIEGVCRDVGHTAQTLTVRMRGHRSNFNVWWRWVKKGRPKLSVRNPSEQGFYQFLVDYLSVKKYDTWTVDNCPNVVMIALDEGVMTKIQSGAKEELWRYRYRRTALNLQPGGTGKGKKRSLHIAPFGGVFWNTQKKVFKVSYMKNNTERIWLPSFHTIQEAYAALLNEWKRLKDTEHYKGVNEPRSLEHYKKHFGEKYNLTF